ncbi:MAG: hypothetical protein NXI02_28500, partial [Rhodobacteraceae bacterium]|nr:hypothetical protein [Paracoccaceae bacterium]
AKNAMCRPDEAARSGNLIHRQHRYLSMVLLRRGFQSGIHKFLEGLTITGEKSFLPQLVWVKRLPDKLTLL